MSVEIVTAGPSRSFPDGVDLTQTGASAIVFVGTGAGTAYRRAVSAAPTGFAAVELGTECLAVHTGLDASDVHARTVGFARFRLGDAPPTALVEIVRQPWTASDAIDAARVMFEAAGLTTALCGDVPGRIVDRLIRPYFNAVLRRVDDGLASAEDMDTTLRLGLGYPIGPNALLRETGLHHHFDVASALHEAVGDADFAPARAARVAAMRRAG